MDERLAIIIAAAAGLALFWYSSQADATTADYSPAPESDPGVDPSANNDGPADPGVLAPVTDVFSAVESYMIPVSTALNDANLKAFLMLIRTGEGTVDQGGYTRLYGGGAFTSFADHPRQSITKGNWTSTAAGAYQILSRTWDDLRRGNDLPDFSPENQDKACVILIRRRGALADVLAGRFDDAIRKCNKEWASLPGSPYGQRTLSMTKAKEVLLSYGAHFDNGTILV